MPAPSPAMKARSRAIVLEEIKGYTDEIKVDALGNVLATKKFVSPTTKGKQKRKP